MSEAIKDGTGSGATLQVYSDNKLAARVVSSTENQDSVFEGLAYNINTGWVTVSANSALLYFENQDDEDFFIDAVAVGLKESSATEVQTIYFVSQPSGGTLYTAATDVDIVENRRVGDGKTFSSSTLIYKATASGQTLTGGRDSALFAQNDGGRLFATVDFIVPKGQAVGLRMEVAGGFSDDVYAAFVGHKVKIL